MKHIIKYIILGAMFLMAACASTKRFYKSSQCEKIEFGYVCQD